MVVGKLGRELSIEQGVAAARLTGLCTLSTLRAYLGDLNGVTRVVRVLGFINCAPGFNMPSNVLNGFSDLMIEVFGEAGHGSPGLEVRRSVSGAAPDIDTFAFVPGLDFHNGTIEVEVAGSPLPDAPAGARGFVGVVFRVETTDGSFGCEGIYLRPTNGRADDQVRRNHSTQYFAYPGHDFSRLRREAPARYKSYVDLVPGEWTAMRIEVEDATAKLFVGTAQQPVLIVKDLKRGADAHGSVGLYVDNGTDGHFRKLRVRRSS